MSPSLEWSAEAAKFGVQLIPAGEMYNFESIWNQVIIIETPKFADYNDLFIGEHL